MTDDTERLEWQDLVQSPGWARLVKAAKAEWDGPGFVNLVDALVDKPDDGLAMSKLRQMMASKRAVERLLNTPRERLAHLDRLPDLTLTGAASRRGSL